MRIHAHTLTDDDVCVAARAAGVRLERFTRHSSRTHNHAYDVILSGSSPHRTQGDPDAYAATWDEWGIFLRVLFQHEPSVMCGNAKRPIYANAAHFHWSTGDRFRDFGRHDQHRTHRWNYSGDSAGGAYSVQDCECGAIRRWLNGMTWAEYSGDVVPAPAPVVEAAPMRERLARLAEDVAQLRREVDEDYPYDPAADRREIASAQHARPDTWTGMACSGVVLDVPTALPWTPQRRRDVVA